MSCRSYSGYLDELVWAALWLYKATGEGSYVDYAVEVYDQVKAASSNHGNE
jgi:endoglucanase